MSGKGKMLNAVPIKEERNMGIELFRVFSMMLVVMLHVLGHGGVYSHTEFLSANYKVAWFLEVIAYCSVNCYALISGYANVKSGFKFRRIVYLWLEVVTLNFGMNALMYFAVPTANIEPDYWIRAFFPLSRRLYWYFCAYFFMFPLIPIMNKGILSLKKYQHIIIMLLLQVPTIFRLTAQKDNYVLGSGYSALWLICLYVLGSYFRIYGAPKWAKWFVTLPVFFAAAFVAWKYKMNIEAQYAQGLIEKDSELYSNRGILISYISPCMVIMAVALLLFFMQIKIKWKIPKLIISNLGKASFGVFILHVGAAVWYWKEFWSKFNEYAKYPTGKMVLFVILATLAIYLSMSLLSLARIYLFKLLRVHKAVDFIADLPTKIKKKHTDGKSAS
jgi:hypothetical protein